ncbi:MAG: tetratricopeptide repeat protein [Polyangiaceae bacterium]
MGDRDRKRGGRRPPPGWGARDTGTELRPPPPELIERLAKTPADPGLPPLDDAEIPSSASGAHGAPGGRWRRPPPPSRTGGAPWPRPGSEPAGAGAPKTAKSPLSTGRANDTMPRLFIPPEEATDPEMVANLAADDEEAEVESADLDLEAEEAPADPHARFDALLAAYAKDFDDDAVRAELEVLADALGRFGELIATAKRLLARTAGTTGEDRVWAQLSRWSKRVHGHESGASPEDRLLDATFAAAPIDGDAPDSVREPPPDFDTFGNNYGSDLRGAEFQSQGFDPAFPIAFDPNFVPFDPSFLGGFPMPAAPAPLGDPLESVADVVDDLDSGELVDDDESVVVELSRSRTLTKTSTSSSHADDVAIGPPLEAEGAVRRLSVLRSELPSGSMRARIPTAPPRSERPVDSRTLFVPQAPPPPATEHELPDDVEELDELDSVAEIEPEIEPEPSARPAARPRQSSGDFGAGRSAPPRTTASHAAVRPAEPAAPPPPRRVDPALLKTEEIEAALAKAPNDVERARILVERAKRELAAGDREKAIDSYRDALAFETTNAAALEALERLYRDGKNVVRLVEILEQKLDLAKTDGQRLEGLLAIAELYENDLGDLPGAITRADAAHGLQPKNAKPLQALARAHHKAKDYRAAIEALEKLLRGETSRAEKLETLLRIASVQENDQGDPEAAIDTYVRILNEHPQHKAALDDLARLADKTGSWKAKAKILEHKVELAKEPRRQAETLVELGDLLAVADRAPEEARKHYERAARVFPSYPMSWRGLEQLSTWSGDAARAEFYLEQRVRHTQDLAERARVLLELAQFRAVTLNKTAESLAAYELAHKADPTNETAANALIRPAVAQKRWQEAARARRRPLPRRGEGRTRRAGRDFGDLLASRRDGEPRADARRRRGAPRLRPEDSALARALLDTAVSQTGKAARPSAHGGSSSSSPARKRRRRARQAGEIFRAAGGHPRSPRAASSACSLKSPTDVRALAFMS